MPQSATAISRARQMFPHLLAGLLALLYAWQVSHTQFVTTAVQFVSPLAAILAAHLLWIAAFGPLKPGFARVALMRMLVTAVGIVAVTVLVVIFGPAPAEANSVLDTWTALAGFLDLLACLAVISFVITGAAVLVAGTAIGLWWLFKVLLRQFGRPPGNDGDRLHDLGLVAVALLVIGAASLEGVAGAFSFATHDRSSSTVAVAAPPARVWQEVGKATSPSFPLPVMLKSIPQPVAVVVDEGAALGARRIVHFKGREGEGDLVLQVVRRTDTEVVFQAVSDTSPIAHWVRHGTLTFRVDPSATGSLLTVSSDYDRLLSPAWFFKPYIRLAAFLADDVLARDTKQRAEASRAPGGISG